LNGPKGPNTPQLAYYADAHVDGTKAAIEEVLANFNRGGNLGGPLRA
jgi:hypothetical protein